mmetsp:Transcript_36927/g.75325  ORF Transcript_36927/g.75325 Transcript_36927/m.75325 type:complete len:128 (-) Transcript_36927:116-499(-)
MCRRQSWRWSRGTRRGFLPLEVASTHTPLPVPIEAVPVEPTVNAGIASGGRATAAEAAALEKSVLKLDLEPEIEPGLGAGSDANGLPLEEQEAISPVTEPTMKHDGHPQKYQPQLLLPWKSGSPLNW